MGCLLVVVGVIVAVIAYVGLWILYLLVGLLWIAAGGVVGIVVGAIEGAVLAGLAWAAWSLFPEDHRWSKDAMITLTFALTAGLAILVLCYAVYMGFKNFGLRPDHWVW